MQSEAGIEMLATDNIDLGSRLCLLAYRFPDFERHVRIPELFNNIDCDARLDVGADSERALVFSYWAEIQRLPADKCKAQCGDLLAQARRMIDLQRRASLYLFEGRGPDSSVDYATWAKMPYWIVDEATAVILARDPNWVDWAKIEPYVKICAFAERFHVIRLLLTRAQQVGHLERKMRPIDVMDWAQRNAIELPPELVSAIGASPVQVSLRAENEALKQQIKKLRESDQLDPREKTSLLKIIYSYAVQKGHRSGRRSAARNISEDSQLAGCDVHEDTVRKYIREAEALGYGAEPSA
jgi:hypothetical protein